MVGLDMSLEAGTPALARVARPSSAFVTSRRIDDALRPFLAARDAAEDVDEDALHALVEVDDLERGSHHVRVGAAADVEEVGGLAADLVDDVERGHGQPGTVGDDADRPLEPDVLEIMRAGELLALVELLGGPVLVPLR